MAGYVSIIGALISIAVGCLAIWDKAKHPIKKNTLDIADLEAKVSTLREQVDKLREKRKGIYDSLEAQAEINKALLKSQWAIMAHLVDGNHTEQLKECKAEAEKLLFEKGASVR